MPSIILVECGVNVKHLVLVKTYRDLFNAGLSRASEQVHFLIHGKRKAISVADDEVTAAMQFINEAKRLGIICKLEPGFSRETELNKI